MYPGKFQQIQVLVKESSDYSRFAEIGKGFPGTLREFLSPRQGFLSRLADCKKIVKNRNMLDDYSLGAYSAWGVNQTGNWVSRKG